MTRTHIRPGDPLYVIDAQMRARQHRWSAQAALIASTAAYHEEVARRYDRVVDEYDAKQGEEAAR